MLATVGIFERVQYLQGLTQFCEALSAERAGI